MFCHDDALAGRLTIVEQYLAACEWLARATNNIDPWAERCIARRHGPADPELHATRTRPAPIGRCEVMTGSVERLGYRPSSESPG